MLLWDKKLRPTVQILEKFTQIQRLRLAKACLNDVRRVFDQTINPLLNDEGREFFRSAFGLIASAHSPTDIPAESARNLVDRMSWLEEAPPDALDMAMSLHALLKRAGGTLSVEDVLESMGCAYQVILRSEVLSKLEEETTETEVSAKEEASPTCVASISKQLQHIADASNSISTN